VRTKQDVRAGPAHATTNTADFDTTREIYNNVRPVDFSELQHRFIDTSLLRQASRTQPEHELPTKTTPLNPEEALREAFVIAFSEREACRVQLNAHYTLNGALEFDEKAKTYNARREQLAGLMPQGELRIEDEMSFPWLSTKDTVEPQVRESIFPSHSRSV
jgi:hypothetical protein